METPLYNGVKSFGDSIESEINGTILSLQKEIEELKQKSSKMTQKQIEKTKKKIQDKAEKTKKKIEQKLNSMKDSLTKKSNELDTMNKILDSISKPPTGIDDVVNYASSVASFFLKIQKLIIQEITDITLTLAYISTEIPKLMTQLTKLISVDLASIQAGIKDSVITSMKEGVK